MTTPLALQLRPYQEEAVQGIYDWFDRERGNPLVVVPTGGGKSLIIAAFVHRVLSSFPDERILVLTHVRELIEQNHKQLLRCWPGAPAGIYSAGLKRREHDARVLFAGIQSVYDKAEKIGWADLVLIDEAHLIGRDSMGRYRQFLDAMQSMNPSLKVIGLTATPFRTGEGSLDKGDDRLFHGIAYTCDLAKLILDGYLSPVTAKSTATTIDTSGVHIRAGDYVESELAAAAMAGDNVPKACREIVARGADRKAWLVFCCSIEHAVMVAEELRGLGIGCATVFGETPKEERDRTVADFRAGRVRCVVNVNVLTTGFDAPQTDLIALLRPTCSPVLHVQMIGRGLRTAEGKANCLVLDFGGNCKRHGPIDAVKLREPSQSKATGEVLARECPQCESLVAIASRICPDCGYEFPPSEEVGEKHADRPEEDVELVAGLFPPRNPIERWRVQLVRFSESNKPGKPATLAVEYLGGVGERVREWVCFEHPAGSFPLRKAHSWWRDRGGRMPPPATIDEARVRIECGELWKVLEVVVDTRGEWPELRGVTLDRDAGTDEVAKAPVSAEAINMDKLPF
jgi:DNA repair protein RadD